VLVVPSWDAKIIYFLVSPGTAAMVVEGFCIQRENRLAGVCVDGHVVGPDSNIDY